MRRHLERCYEDTRELQGKLCSSCSTGAAHLHSLCCHSETAKVCSWLPV